MQVLNILGRLVIITWMYCIIKCRNINSLYCVSNKNFVKLKDIGTIKNYRLRWNIWEI